MTTVYGNRIDLANADVILGDAGYTYVNTEGMTPDQLKTMIKAGDVIVGGTGAVGGVGFDVQGAQRLAGEDREITAKKILNFATANMYSNFNNLIEQNGGFPKGATGGYPSSLPSSTGNVGTGSNPLTMPYSNNPSDNLVTTPKTTGIGDMFGTAVGLMFIFSILSIFKGFATGRK